jgi:hypothetical protein
VQPVPVLLIRGKMFVNQDMIEKFRDGTWGVDCLAMKLGQTSAAGPTRFVGPGYLRQNPDGTVGYKLYPPPPAVGSASLVPTALLQAGQLLGAHHYHQLEALDSTGVTWLVERTLPVPQKCSLSGRWYEVVSGTAHELNYRKSFIQGVSSLTLVFFTEVEIPGNASTEVTTVVAGENTQRTSRLDVAKFSTALGDFLVYNRRGMLVVDVSAAGPFPPHFETRVTEALALVLAKPLVWNVAMLHDGGAETVRVRPGRDPMAASLPPPVLGGKIDMSGGDVWRLFGKYLTLVCTHAGDGFHPCSRHLYSVLEASAGAISSRALALGVAVEGIAKDMFPEAGALPPTLKPTVRRLRKYLRAWEEFKDGSTKDALYDRVETMLGKLLDVGGASRLYALAQKKAVYEQHIRAWKDLRHAAAHGVTPSSDDLQVLVNLCNAVTVLMYHLIFRAAGYEGSYRDYSTYDYPKKRYRGRPVTEEEKTVAAYYLWEKGLHQDDVSRWYAGLNDLEQGNY